MRSIKMDQTFKALAVLFIVVFMSACSASKTTEESDGFAEQASDFEQAETDVVPLETPEVPAQPAEEVATNETLPLAEPPAEKAPEPQVTSGEHISYTVQSGDTLMKIAFEQYGNLYEWKKIKELNSDQLEGQSQLKPGMVLKIEKPAVPVVIEKNGERYLIKHGDTLGVISNNVYGTQTRWKEIWNNNKQLIKNPNKIYAGFYLYYVPDSSVSTTPMAKAPEPVAPAAATGDVSSNSTTSNNGDVGTIDTNWGANAGAQPSNRAPASAAK